MKEGENYLEEKSRELLKAKYVKGKGLYLSDICSLENYILVINYLTKNHYLVEVGNTVKDFHYELTFDGKLWIKNNN